tara:strand:- start:17060 stop:18040 length:981 start_codon:yes stop_codon:yes gene_type:complete
MKKKAYDVSKLTSEQKVRLSLSNQSENFLGIRGDTLLEPAILPLKSKSEKRFIGENGQCISLMRDTPRAPGSGYGAQTGAGAISIGVGYSSDDPANATATSPDGLGLQPLVSVRDHKTTAAEIYISQKTDVDDNLNLPAGNIGKLRAKSAITLKADSIRIVGREGIKFVSGVSGEEANSGGGIIRSVPRINFIGGEDDSNLQPIARAQQMEEVISDIYEQISELNSILDTFMTTQIEFNGEVMTHQHGSVAIQSVGVIAAGNPFAINDGKTDMSYQLLSSGMKAMSTEYTAKVDGIMQKLQLAVTSFNSSNAVGPKNPSSPSFYTT